MTLRSQPDYYVWDLVDSMLDRRMSLAMESMQLSMEGMGDSSHNQLVLDAFQKCCGDLVIDANLAKAISQYHARFVTKNADHIAFFGGHLLGVYPVKFLATDEATWFNEIIQVDSNLLVQALEKFKELNNDRVVSSDAMNLSCIWLAHKLYHANIDPHLKEEAMLATILVLQYKFLTSRLFVHFRYPADPAVAEAMYSELSHKFAIKKYGSWSGVFMARAQDIIGRGGIHYQTLVEFKPDKGIVYMLNDIQGRIREMIKNLYDEHIRVLHSGTRISKTSLSAEFDGESILKDTTKSLTQYRRYLDSVVANPASFIRDELVKVILQMMETAPERVFRETLLWMSKNYRLNEHSTINQVMDHTLVHAFSYLNKERGTFQERPNLPNLLGRLKGVYTSARSTDAHLLQLRTEAEKLVALASGVKNPATLSSVRTALLLYLVARTFTMNHYG